MSNTALDLAVARLKIEEGFRAKAYRDTRGLLTVGYGFCVEAGISQYAAEALLRAQLEERIDALLGYPWYAACDALRQSVLLDLAFNDGVAGVLKFHNMIAAIGRQDWTRAKAELLDSDAARALPVRYALLAELLFAGQTTMEMPS